MKRYVVFSSEEVLYATETVSDISSEIYAQGLNLEQRSDPISSLYVYGNALRKRPSMPVSLEGNMLINVRPNSQIVINEKAYECEEGGSVELEFDQPGIYSVRVSRWPYLDREFRIEN